MLKVSVGTGQSAFRCAAAASSSASLSVLRKYALAISYEDLQDYQHILRPRSDVWLGHLPADCGAWHGGDYPRPPTPHKSTPAELPFDDGCCVEEPFDISNLSLLAQSSRL